MPEELNDKLRAWLIAALAENSARLRDGLRAELARSITLADARPLQFEADPWTWGISSCASEEPVITDDWLTNSLSWVWFEQADTAGLNVDAIIADELCPWFAAGWQDVGGPSRFSPAYLFLHDYHSHQYDLERRQWVSADEVFGA